MAKALGIGIEHQLIAGHGATIGERKCLLLLTLVNLLALWGL